MSPAFKDGLNQYYASPDDEAYINRVKYYLELFDNGKGDTRYADFMEDVRQVLKKAGTASEKKVESQTKPDDVKTKQKPSAGVESVIPKSEPKKPMVKQSSDTVKEKTVQQSRPKPNVTFGVDDGDVQVSKAMPRPQNQQSIVKKARTGKYEIFDLTTKTIKFTIADELMMLFEQHFNEVAKNYLLSSGLLTETEMQILAEGKLSPVKIYKNHDFVLTRSDLFTMLILLGLTHLNVDLKDDTVSDIFDNNTVKADFYQQLLNSNLVELDIQSRVQRLQQKVEKSVGQNERIEAMLSLLLLERANVPKDQNRESIKGALETSSVMNQALESFSVLDGVIGSKLLSIKDYKRARGE